MDVSFIKYRVYSSGIPFKIEPPFSKLQESVEELGGSWGHGSRGAEAADLCLEPA